MTDNIREQGYRNTLVYNKWNQNWTKLDDPYLSYQGYHFYFNSWSPSGAITQMQQAKAKGIPLINTEVGASYNEASDFTSSTVKELSDFLAWCAENGVSNTIWMNENLNNWSTYLRLGLKISGSGAPPPTPTPTPTASGCTLKWLMGEP